MKITYTLLLCCSAILLHTKTFAQAGTPDATFGTNGMVVTNVGNFNETTSIAIQPDGKILAAGYVNTSTDDFAVVRHNANGSIDQTFGNAGAAVYDFNYSSDQAQGMALQADGKIVLAGYTGLGSGNANFALMRLLPDGTPDSTFGTNGKVVTDFIGYDDYAFEVAIQADGKIVAAGPASNDAGIVRYNPDGTLDVSFNGTGKLLADITGGYEAVMSMTLQPDGKIVIGGYGSATSNYDFVVARFNTNGSYDNSFGTNGRVQTAVGAGEDIGLGIVVQPDGKIVLAGYTWTSSTDTDYGIVRYNANGSLDNSFGTNGIATGPIGASYDYLRAITLQPDGKIVAAGQTSTPGWTDCALLRFNTNGTLDNSFNGTGIVVRDVVGEQDYAYTVAMQPDGKILFAGATQVYPDVDMVLARYNSGLDLQSVDETNALLSAGVYPNPVSAVSVVEYTLAQEEEVSVEVFDAVGRKVLVVAANVQQDAGVHRVSLGEMEKLAPGVYSVVLTAGEKRKPISVVR